MTDMLRQQTSMYLTTTNRFPFLEEPTTTIPALLILIAVVVVDLEADKAAAVAAEASKSILVEIIRVE